MLAKESDWGLFLQVFQGCGNPKINPKPSNVEDKKKRVKSVSEDKTSGLGLEKLVSIASKSTVSINYFWEGEG